MSVLTFDAAMIGRDGGTGELEGGVSMDGSTSGGDAAVHDGGVDAGGPIDGFPDVPRVHVGHMDWNPLTLVSHNVVQDPVTDYEELFLVVRNDSPTTTFCSIVFRVELFDSAGTSITFRTGTITGDPRRIYSLDADCVPPGATGLGYGNSSWSLDLEAVARIQYLFNGSGGAGPDVQTIAAVTEEGRTIVDPYGGGVYSAVRGALRVVSGSIRSPSVTVFPLDARGLPYAQLRDIELVSVYAGSSWPYTTTGTDQPFTTFLSSRSYRGTSSALVLDTPETRAALAARDAHEALTRETERRLDDH